MVVFEVTDTRDSSAIRSEPTVDGVRWDLPPRALGRIRGFAWVLLPFGLLLTGVCLLTAAHTVYSMVSGGGVIANAPKLVPVAAFLFLGLIFMAAGFAVRGGSSRIEIGRRRIRLVERAGPFRWSWSRPTDRLRRLQVHREPVKVNGQPLLTGPLSDLGYIKAEFDGKVKPLALAVGYPGEVVTELAEQLARYCRTVTPPGLFEHHSDLVELDDAGGRPGDQTGGGASGGGAPNQQVFGVRQPASSAAVLTEGADGLNLLLPPVGVWKETMGMAKIGVVWCVIVGLIMIGMLLSKRGMPLRAVLGVGAFWAVGFAMLLAGVNMGRRRAIIDVVGDTLLVTRQNLFGTKQQEWRRDEIAAIRADASGMESNNRPIMELQFHLVNGKKVGMFAGRRPDELRWIADVLRGSVRVPARRS